MPSSVIQTYFEDSPSDAILLHDACNSADTNIVQKRPGCGITEMIAACGFGNTTVRPGRHSFTYALTEYLRRASLAGNRFSIALSGCVSESLGIPNVYFANLHENGTDSDIRIGFFGLCHRPTSNSTFTCVPSALGDPEDIAKNLNASTTSSAVPTALDLQKKILASPLICSAFLFLLSTLFTAFDRYQKQAIKHPSPKSEGNGVQPWWPRIVALVCCWVSTLLVFGAAFSATQTLKAIQYVSEEEIEAGTTMLAFHWVTFLLGLVFSRGLKVIFVYERMGGDDGGDSSFGNSVPPRMTPQREPDENGGGGGDKW